MSNSSNLPAPWRGQDTNTPNAVLQSPFCETLYNFNTTDAGISLRKGDSKWASKLVNNAGGVTVEVFLNFIQYANTNLFMAIDCDAGVQNRYYDITTSGAAPTLAYTSVSGIAGEIFTTYFNKRVYIYGTLAPTVGDYYDGSAWGSWGYTMPGASRPIGGCSYKNRQYFVFINEAAYGYSEIDAVTGTVTKIDLSSVISESSELAIITPISISNETSSVQLLAFVFFSGEVLFYSGSYPDSDSWSLVAAANIGQPLNYNSTIAPYQGDSLVACRNGLVSLRDLFLRGSDQASALFISKPITPDWDALIAGIVSSGIVSPNGRMPQVKSAWWKKKNRLVVSFPYYLDTSGTLQNGSTYFIYDTIRESWTVHRSYGCSNINGVTVFKDNFLIATNAGATALGYLFISNKEGATDYQDVSIDNSTKVNYDYTVLSAPIPFTKTEVHEATQIEPILKSDLFAQTNWNFIADFGKQTSGNQKTDALTTTITKPAVNVGMQNITYVQVKLSGTTTASKSVGLDLYSYNVWHDAGKKGSR